MEGNRGAAKAFLEHRRKKVLAGMLLHVIETARPLHATLNWSGREFAIDDMQNVIFGVAHIENFGVAEPSKIVRLAAGRGIKRRAIEQYFPGRHRARFRGDRGGGFAAEDFRLELLQVRIVVVEAAGCHGVASLAWLKLPQNLASEGVCFRERSRQEGRHDCTQSCVKEKHRDHTRKKMTRKVN